MTQSIPVYVLSGFLGSGKTTLLARMLTEAQREGKRPAVVMNELGDVNLDGQTIASDIPMAEILGGCICCSYRNDLTTQLASLVSTESPELIIIEATGAANPMEILDAVAEVSLYTPLALQQLITVVDAIHLHDLYEQQKGRTYRLMQEQIRCASLLILNKTDRIDASVQEQLERLLRQWNAHALIVPAQHCEVSPAILFHTPSSEESNAELHQEDMHEHEDHSHNDVHTHDLEPKHNHDDNHKHGHQHGHQHGQKHEHAQPLSEHSHQSHEHVMVYTHYFDKSVNSVHFEELLRNLPRDIYRAKGILTFSDTSGRFMFQYAYRESDFMKVEPQGQIRDVAVFIGEHFDKEQLVQSLKRLV
ncbi:CobW family GTP-binding protein [Paenibacillus sp. FSL K6-1230]|uniref:CobW family GTP-binding protein n=1 Tax=Paenibacillus sp. FSL K6-1230 TaxID=2921603 RepID=UPI0030F919A3